MFWFGDLNFRIESLDIRFVKYAIDSNILSQLWEKDQVSWGTVLWGLWLLPALPVQLWHGSWPSLSMGLPWCYGEGTARSRDGLSWSWAHVYCCAVDIGSMDSAVCVAWMNPQSRVGLAAVGQGRLCAGGAAVSGVGQALGAAVLPGSCSFPQLNIAKSTWPVLSGFQEGPLNFPPTFKFDVGTNKYDSRWESSGARVRAGPAGGCLGRGTWEWRGSVPRRALVWVDGWTDGWGRHGMDWGTTAVLVPAQVCPCSRPELCAEASRILSPARARPSAGGGGGGWSPLPSARQEMPLCAPQCQEAETRLD